MQCTATQSENHIIGSVLEKRRYRPLEVSLSGLGGWRLIRLQIFFLSHHPFTSHDVSSEERTVQETHLLDKHQGANSSILLTG